MSNPPRLLSEVQYAAYLAYSPRGMSAISKESKRLVVEGIKRDGYGFIERLAAHMATHWAESGLDDYLGPETTLIPVPGSASMRPGTLWPALRLCEELRKQALGKEVIPCLQRTAPVAKSAFAKIGERPGAEQHFSTLEIVSTLDILGTITVVDDVITKGSTLLAAVSHVQTAFPGTPVRAFAAARAMGLVPDVDRIVHPVIGRIRWDGTKVLRDP